MKEGKVGCEGGEGVVEEEDLDADADAEEVISSNKLITSGTNMKVYG